MIKITIKIEDTPLSDGTFYGRIEAIPENVEPVSNHECQMRDMIMEGLQEQAKEFVQSEGITRSIIAKIPLKRRKKNEQDSDDRRDPRSVR